MSAYMQRSVGVEESGNVEGGTRVHVDEKIPCTFVGGIYTHELTNLLVARREVLHAWMHGCTMSTFIYGW